MMEVERLKPHPKNNYYFDDIDGESWTAFLESIETSGVIEPIIVDAADLTIVSGHQRVRACKKLGIKQVAVEERHYDNQDEVLKQLIETNIRQRGVGNTNAVKFGRCIKELERIYGIKHGGDRASGHNVNLKNQDDLASELEMSKKQMSRFKSLTDLIPELQSAVESGQITATTAMGFVKKLTPDEQKKLAESISGKEKVSSKEVDNYVSEIKRLTDENKRLKDDNVVLSKRARPDVVVKEINVIPDDYEEAKRNAQMYEADNTRLMEENKANTEELLDAKRQIQELQDASKKQKLIDEAIDMSSFTAATNSYISMFDGKTFVINEEIPQNIRDDYIIAVQALCDFAHRIAFKKNRSDEQ